MTRTRRLLLALLILCAALLAWPSDAQATTPEHCRIDFGHCLDNARGILAVQRCQAALATCQSSTEPAPPCFIELPTANRIWHVRPDAIEAYAAGDSGLRVKLTSGTRLRVILDLEVFRERLSNRCGTYPSIPANPPATQGFVFDLAQDIVQHLAGDEERLARWVSNILLEATDRGFLEIDPDLADDIGAWIALGLRLMSQADDVTIHELADWVDDGVALIQRHRLSRVS